MAIVNQVAKLTRELEDMEYQLETTGENFTLQNKLPVEGNKK
jgi:hypothetical protein